MKNLFPALALVVLLSGCGPSVRSPKFYPNEKLATASVTEVDQAVKDCQDLTDKYVSDPSHYQSAAKSTAVGGTLGAAGGAVAGAVVGGSVGRSVGAGAAAGAVVALLQQLFSEGETNPNREKFMEQCLDGKGYKVYGWE